MAINTLVLMAICDDTLDNIFRLNWMLPSFLSPMFPSLDVVQIYS